MKNYIKNTYVITLAILALGVLSSNVQAESVNGAVAAALSNHPGLEAAQARIDASEQAESEQFSGYFPDVNIGAKAGRIFGDNSTTRGLVVTRGEAYSGYGEASISLKQPLLGTWQTAQQVEAARARKLSAGQSFMDVQEKLALITAKTYVELIRHSEIINYFQKRLRGMSDLVSRIESAVKEGGVEETDLQRARDLLFVTKKIMAMSEASFQAAREQYRESVGAEPKGELVKPSVAIDSAPIEVVDAVAYALNNNPAYIAAQFNADASQSELRAEKWALAPDLDGELSYLRSDQDDAIGGETIDARAILRLNWDFSTGGAQLARIKKKRFEHKEARATAADYKKQLEKFVRISYANYGVQLDLLEYEKQRDALSKKIYKSSKIQFDGARISLLDLLRAYDERSKVNYDKINAKYAVIGAQYDLLASIGLLRASMGLASASAAKAADDQGK